MDSILKDEEKTLIETFISITSSSREEAFFFLESHNFQLESAIHSFFENAGNQDEEQEPFEEIESSIPPSIPNLTPPSIPSHGASSRGGGNDDKKKRIRTLADLHQKVGSESASDDDEPQEYYTGGEKSGMLVQDPTRGGHDADAIFDQARQMGAMQGPFEHHPSSSSRSFMGTGRLLSGETVAPAPRPPENVMHNIYFWSNGFSVDDGPLRRFDDPANASFLESIKKSECPKELEPEDRRTTVNVNLMRKEENYPEPVKCVATFQGVGRTLGSSSATSSTTETPVAILSPSVSAVPIVVDESELTTSIQLRLADGSRAVARFNANHTVGDIRAFIDSRLASNGRALPATYSLQTVGFPPKQLTDATQTIEQAGLANSVVIQRL